MSDNESQCDDGLINSVLDSDRLINEIEKRPALYNKELKEYSDRNVKEKLRAEVCLHVCQNWNVLTGTEKKNKGMFDSISGQIYYLKYLNYCKSLTGKCS